MHPGCDIEQVYLCREPIDFRKSINGLSVLVEQELELNPFGAVLYVFVNRQRNKLKVLYWYLSLHCAITQSVLLDARRHGLLYGDANFYTKLYVHPDALSLDVACTPLDFHLLMWTEFRCDQPARVALCRP